MAFRNPTFTFSRRSRLILPVIAILILIVVLLVVFTGIYTDYLFYREVQFKSVFSTVYKTRILLFILAGLVVSVIAVGNAVVAYRIRPPFRPASLEQQNLDRYRLAIEPRLRLLVVLLGGVVTLFAGLAGQAKWQTWLLWRHGQPFPGQTDPQFHKNISFYLFTYPMERLALDVAFVGLAIAIVISVFVHYLYGGIRLQTPGEKAVPAAKAHISVLLGVFVLLKAVAYYLDRYGLNYSTRGFVDTGASYTDVHIVLPAKTILLVIAIVCAMLFFANIRLRGWLLPGVALGLLVLSAVVIGAIVPAIVQNFSVKPNEVTKETPYIQRNINETRFAYGLTGVNETAYDPQQASASAASADTANVGNVRLLDPEQLSPTYDQLQQLKNYYGFPQDLDIDRYTINGKLQDYVVAARELNLAGLTPAQQNWINEHLAYTHGNGLVAAPANQVDSEGRPVFSAGEQNIPPTGVLGLDAKNPDGGRIYFGENAPPYSVVDTKQKEIDGPGVGAQDQATNTYDGTGGVKLSTVDRLLYAIHFQDPNLVLSSSITTNSRIMYYRNPRERVQKVAPWLTLDGDPYPTVIAGRVTWVLDGYTTSNLFPYSARRTLGDVTADATNTQTNSNNAQQANDQVNYIRNSVKATVDAANGTVNLYAFDPTDPVLRTWMSIFPGTVKPASQMPTDLVNHIRYPEDLFKVQRDLLSQYHVTDPATFYSKQDAWDVPTDPSNNTGAPQPPFYVVSQVPGQASPQFNLTTTYVPQGGRKNLAAFLSVSSGPGTPKTSTAYGAFTLLRAPQQSPADGVPQVQNNFNSFAAFSRDRTQFDQGGSRVINGNLLSIPTGNGILYVEPIYLTGTSSANGTLPVLREVLTSYDGVIGYSTTLAGALAQSFGAAPQATASSTPAPGASSSPSPSVSSSAAGSPAPTALPTSVVSVAQQLQAALAAQQREAAAGDYTAAAASQARVNALVAQLGSITGAVACACGWPPLSARHSIPPRRSRRAARR